MGYKPIIIIAAILTATRSISITTFDPMSIGAGARALGMGGAYLAVAEEGDVFFSNPAGLGEIDAFKFTSMSGTVLEDAKYTLLGVIYPLGDKNALGLGFASAVIGGVEIRNSSGILMETSNYSNNVFLASVGRKVTEKISLGINLKYFSQDGTENNNGDGSGINLDIGFLQNGQEGISWGMVGKNILNSGKMRYTSGQEEDLPRAIKIGAKMYLFGEKIGAANLAPVEIYLMGDAELRLEGNQPLAAHIGAEFSPVHNLILRAGIDQSPKPEGLQSSITAGVSLRVAGLSFHYAYHPYTEFAENTSHYFSISFDERGWPYEGPPDTFLGSASIAN